MEEEQLMPNTNIIQTKFQILFGRYACAQYLVSRIEFGTRYADHTNKQYNRGFAKLDYIVCGIGIIPLVRIKQSVFLFPFPALSREGYESEDYFIKADGITLGIRRLDGSKSYTRETCEEKCECNSLLITVSRKNLDRFRKERK